MTTETTHTCPYCKSKETHFLPSVQTYWCNACWRWDETGDDGEQSREEMARDENAAIDKQERR